MCPPCFEMLFLFQPVTIAEKTLKIIHNSFRESRWYVYDISCLYTAGPQVSRKKDLRVNHTIKNIQAGNPFSQLEKKRSIKHGVKIEAEVIYVKAGVGVRLRWTGLRESHLGVYSRFPHISYRIIY